MDVTAEQLAALFAEHPTARLPPRPALHRRTGPAAGQRSVPPAKLSPFASTGKLGADGERVVAAIHDAVEEVSSTSAAGGHELVRRPSGWRARTGEACPVCGDTIREVEYSLPHGPLLPTCPDGRQGPGRQHHQPLPQVAPAGWLPSAACRSTSGPSQATTRRPCCAPATRAGPPTSQRPSSPTRCVNEERGMLGFTGTFEDRPLSVQSTGMGCPSAHRLRGADPAGRPPPHPCGHLRWPPAGDADGGHGRGRRRHAGGPHGVHLHQRRAPRADRHVDAGRGRGAAGP